MQLSPTCSVLSTTTILMRYIFLHDFTYELILLSPIIHPYVFYQKHQYHEKKIKNI